MTKKTRISIPHSPASFPLPELIDNGVWAQIPNAAKAVLAVIWNYHRQYPDSCHPSRQTIAREAGVHVSTVTRNLDVLEEMGIVRAIPRPGPRSNHYEVCWTDISLGPVPKQTRTSPYSWPRTEWDGTLSHDVEDKVTTKYARRGGYFHRMADGCLVRSAVEVVVHEHLMAWKVPHWTDVAFANLAFDLRHPKTGERDTTSTVDFVVAPFYLIEVQGLTPHQGAARKYTSKLEWKKDAIRAHRVWSACIVKPDKRPGEWILKHILRYWAKATIEHARELRDLMKLTGKYEASHEPSQWLDEMIADAEDRMSGRKPQRKARGLHETVTGPRGFPVERRTKPDLVLMEIAGEEYAQRLIDEADRQLDDDYVPPTPPSARPPATPPAPAPIKVALPDPSARRPGESEDDYLDRLLDE